MKHGKSIIDHTIRINLGLTVQQYVFIDCIHQFTLKKKYILDWKDIRICIGYHEDEIIECFRSVKEMELLEVKPDPKGTKIRTTDKWASLFVELDLVEEVLRYLNVKTGSQFKKETDSTVKMINGRRKSGYTLEDFIAVIDSKVEEWIDDPKMKQYLRPATLFTPANFEAYLQTANSKTVTSNKFVS